MIVRQKAPLNLETHFSQLTDWIVGVEEFFVRNHFPTPVVNADEWRLAVGGTVRKPLSLSLNDIAALPRTEMAAVVECAGNGRVFYEPVRQGLQWQNGAVGNAMWSGVSLLDVLDVAGVDAAAVEVVLTGADSGLVDGGQKTASPGTIAFARSIPIAKAGSGDVLLATHMNGEPLTQEHGFPLRAVVGGWYGMAWVKWLAEIRVVDKPFGGYWQMRDYFRWSRDLGEPRLVPLAEMEVKSQIAQPLQGAKLAIGRRHTISGMAWSGHGPIRRVEIAIDDGPWQEATLAGPEAERGWRQFSLDLTPQSLGRTAISARATDAAGNTQPASPQSDRESYCVNWIVPVVVNIVETTGRASDEYTI